MTDSQFFYWLQGYFELSGHKEPLNITQADCIERHAKLVRAALPHGAELPERLGVIETMAKLMRQEFSTAIAVVATNAIRTCVHEQFVHVIDPAAGGPEQQAKLNEAHAGRPPHAWDKPVMRC
jgi:hypothetical protein